MQTPERESFPIRIVPMGPYWLNILPYKSMGIATFVVRVYFTRQDAHNQLHHICSVRKDDPFLSAYRGHAPNVRKMEAAGYTAAIVLSTASAALV